MHRLSSPRQGALRVAVSGDGVKGTSGGTSAEEGEKILERDRGQDQAEKAAKFSLELPKLENEAERLPAC